MRQAGRKVSCGVVEVEASAFGEEKERDEWSELVASKLRLACVGCCGNI